MGIRFNSSANNVPMNKVGTTGSAGSASSAAISDTGSAGSAQGAGKGNTIHYAPKANFAGSSRLSIFEMDDAARVQSAGIEFRDEWKRIKGSVVAAGSGSGAMNGCKEDFEKAKSELLKEYNDNLARIIGNRDHVSDLINNIMEKMAQLKEKFGRRAEMLTEYREYKAIYDEYMNDFHNYVSLEQAYRSAISGIQSISFDDL